MQTRGLRHKKIYGVYPGNLTKKQVEDIDDYTEGELFILISNLEKKYESKKRFSKIRYTEDIKELKCALEYAIYKANKYKLNIPSSSESKNIKETIDYLL